MPKKKSDRRRYGSYYWIDPKTNLGYAKVRIPTDEKTKSGKTKYKILTKRAKNQTAAEDIALELLAEHTTRGSAFMEGYQMSFSDLADWYQKIHSIPPVYSDDGSKVGGIRTFETEIRRLKKLKEFFGKNLIKNIDEDVLRRYKTKREKDKVSAATINRDFEILRAMFRKAVRRRWLRESPFDFGEKLIEKALEKRREVILTDEEETAILLAAEQSEKTLLYYAILCLLDTGARPSEIYDASTVKAEPVLWRDFFDYDFKAVKLTSYKGRKKLVRFAPVTKRLESAMLKLWHSIKEDERDVNVQIFPVSSFKTAWGKARIKADLAIKITKKLKLPVVAFFDGTISEAQIKGLKLEMSNEPFLLDVRLRDLRRNFGTRLAKLGMENDLRQRILGHSNHQTTFDYIAANLETVSFAKGILDTELEGRIIESDGVN